MTEIFLVRHAQASFADDNYDKLSELGHQQSKWLGEYFCNMGIVFDEVFTGDQNRHQQTARGITNQLHESPPAFVIPGLNEFDFHNLFCAAGHEYLQLMENRREAPRQFFMGLKQVLGLWINDQLSEPAKESWPEFYARVNQALSRIRTSKADNILVVSSGGPISTMIGMLLHCHPVTMIELNFQIINASVSRVFCNDAKLVLASFNTLPHLDSPERKHAITYG
ncbi:Putative phosphoserine phosphatase 2 [Thalassocella blandensis]|nr:Putative phosphoserine phosphatase 2 [Thalassocella blandensis]